MHHLCTYLPTRAGHHYITIIYVYKSNKRDCFERTRRRTVNWVYCCYYNRPVCLGLAWCFSTHVRVVNVYYALRAEITLHGHVVSKTRTNRFRLRSESKITNAMTIAEP